jgi:ABC-type nitrate/sulfonate/bicarbonate transport system substrate-binding protein
MVAGRVDAVQLWEPAYSILAAGGEYRAIDFIDLWQEKLQQEYMPYQGIAAHKAWVDANPDLIKRLYATYEQTVDFIMANPGEAAGIIGAAAKMKPEIFESLIKANRPGFKMYWGGDQRAAGQAMFKAAIELGFMKNMPPDSVFYDKPA